MFMDIFQGVFSHEKSRDKQNSLTVIRYQNLKRFFSEKVPYFKIVMFYICRSIVNCDKTFFCSA